MTVSKTPKFQLTRWSADTDEFSRVQMTQSHDAIDEFAVLITQGSGAPPAVTSVLYNSLYFQTSTQKLFYCDPVADAFREITLDTAIKAGLLTAKGDIVARSASGPVALPVGTNGQVLSANSAQTSGLQWIDSVTPTGSQTLTNKTLTSPVLNTPTINRGILSSPIETWTVSTSPISTTLGSVVQLNLLTAQSSAFLYTGDATNTWIPNIRGDGSTPLNSILGVGQSITVSVAARISVTAAFSSTIQIDGLSNTILWQGGISPTSGNASSTDVYTYAIVKTASATYTVFASRTRFASA